MLAVLAAITIAQVPVIDWKAHFESETATVVATGLKFTEGPCWVGDAFLFCEVNANKIHRWVPGESSTTTAFEPSAGALGIAIHNGKVYLAQHGARQISVGAIKDKAIVDVKPFAERFEGRRLIDTNDVVVGKDGTVYFTDPQYFNRNVEDKVPHLGVYRVGKDGKVELLAKDLANPNGLALLPGEGALMVAEHGKNRLHRIDLKTKQSTLFTDLAEVGAAANIQGPGRCDGIRFDVDGNLYSTGPGGIYVLAPNGKLIGFLASPRTSNLAFGGADGRTLLLTRGSEVAMIRTRFAGNR